MQAPKISKTWTVSANNQLIFEGRPGAWNERVRQRSKLWLAIKNMFVTLGWTVARSAGCQKVDAPWLGDGVTHLSNADNIPDWQHAGYDAESVDGPGYATHPHAWVVLKPPASLGTQWSFIFEFQSEDWLAYEGSAGISFYGSPTGHDLTTGWPGKSPLANGRGDHGPIGWTKVGWSPGYWGVAGSSNYDETVHGMASADGRQIRIFACTVGSVHWAFTFDYLDHPTSPTGTWDPVVWSFNCSGSSTRNYCYPMGYGRLNDSAVFYSAYAGTAYGVYGSSEGYGGATQGENLSVPNEFTGAWEVTPVTIFGSNAGLRGRLGVLADTWWTPTYVVDGALLATQDSRNLVVVNNMAMPWNENDAMLFGEMGQGL